MDKLFRSIGESEVFFVSPHLDDAAFSAGSFIVELAKKTKVTVINVFTQADSQPYTYSAKKYLSLCNEEDAKSLFEIRKQEDEAVLSKYATIINLDFIDAQWRKHKVNAIVQRASKIAPELIHTYPVYRWHIISGRVSQHDKPLIARIAKELKSTIPRSAIVFCPAALGNHVDHVLVRDVCSRQYQNIYYWSDFPYNIKFQENRFVKNNDFRRVNSKINPSKKYALIKGYSSQLHDIIRLPRQEQEVFYYKNI